MIESDIAARIRSGEFVPEARLPSETALAEMYGVSRMTVRQALKLLERSQLIVSRQGSGNFVSRRADVVRQTGRLRSFSDELLERGVRVDTLRIAYEVVQGPVEVVERLGASFERATRVRRLRLIAGRKVAYQDSLVPFSVAPGLEREEFVDGSLYRTLNERFGIEFGWAEQTVTAECLPSGVAHSLEAPIGSPALRIERTTYSSSQQVIEFANSWSPADVPLSMRLNPADSSLL